MSKQETLKNLSIPTGRFIATRAVVFYLVIGLLSLTIINLDKMTAGFQVKKAFHQISTVGYAFDDLLKISDEGMVSDHDKLKKYIKYFESLSRYLTDSADVYGILGFCYFYSGELDRSVEHFKKANDLDDGFFWFHYNLGVVYYQLKQFEKSKAAVEEAVSLDPSRSLEFMRDSRKVYWPILGSNENFKKIKPRLAAGYGDGVRLLILNYFNLGEFLKVRQVANNAIASNLDKRGELYYYSGLAAYQLGDYSKAVGYLEESMSRGYEFSEAYQYCGLALKEEGRTEESIVRMQKAQALTMSGKSNVKEFERLKVQLF